MEPGTHHTFKTYVYYSHSHVHRREQKRWQRGHVYDEQRKREKKMHKKKKVNKLATRVPHTLNIIALNNRYICEYGHKKHMIEFVCAESEPTVGFITPNVVYILLANEQIQCKDVAGQAIDPQ